MKGRDIIKMIQERGLEDFELQLSTMTTGEIFPNVTSFSIDGLADIGHSDKVLILEGTEINK